MATPYITIGCPTTGGGQVISGNSSFLVEGIAIACVGDKATCPTHKTTATIVSGDPYMQVMGKSVARVNDSLSCGCKLLPKQNLVVGATGASVGTNLSSSLFDRSNNNLVDKQVNQYSQRFQLKDELTNEVLDHICYEFELNGKILHGTTDKEGFTEEIISEKEEPVILRIIAEDHSHVS